MYNRECNATLTNCVVFGNGGANTFYNGTYGFVSRVLAAYSLFEAGVTGYEGENNLTTPVSPFVSPTDARLNGCSPAINTGTNGANTTTTDLDGNPRRYNNGVIDMGAYEYQAAPSVVTLTAPGVSTATVGVAFSQNFTAAGGTAPYSYSVASGSLPPGLSLATTGVLSGTPTQSGSFTITVLGRDATGCVGTGATYILTVTAPPTLTNFAASPSPVCVGSPVTFTATVSNVNGPYNYTLTNGSNWVTGTANSMAFSQVFTAGIPNSQSFTLIINNGGSVATVITTVLVNPLPTVSLLVSGGVLQVSGGVLFERVIVIDRINGYEIRQTDSNTTGFFPVSRTGPYLVMVTGANGCRATVEGRIDTLP